MRKKQAWKKNKALRSQKFFHTQQYQTLARLISKTNKVLQIAQQWSSFWFRSWIFGNYTGQNVPKYQNSRKFRIVEGLWTQCYLVSAILFFVFRVSQDRENTRNICIERTQTRPEIKFVLDSWKQLQRLFMAILQIPMDLLKAKIQWLKKMFNLKSLFEKWKKFLRNKTLDKAEAFCKQA